MKLHELFKVYMAEAGSDGSQGGSGSPTRSDTNASNSGGTQSTASPNANWKTDPNLDANGNPKDVSGNNGSSGNGTGNSTGNSDGGNGGGNQPTKEAPTAPKSDEAANNDGAAQGASENQSKSSEYEYTADMPVVKQVEGLLKDAGLSADNIGKEMLANDGKLQPQTMKMLVEKHGEAVASLVADKLSTFHSSNKAKATQRDEAVFNQVQEAFKGITEQSGKDTWGELSGWAKDNVPKSERQEINKLLQQGGLAAKFAVDNLVNRFKSSNQFVQSAELETGDNTNNTRGVTPISRDEYNREMHKLFDAGHVHGRSSELANLDKRREAGLRAGI